MRRLARQLNPRVTDAQIQEVIRTRSVRFRHALLNVERDVIAGLKRLRKKGYRLGLISNCGLDEIEAWPDSPLAQLLDTAVFSCQVGRRKPDPTIYSL
ncbi:MAG: HAD hydrolase-like protein, partial [candidate division WOR-3 bacterium]